MTDLGFMPPRRGRRLDDAKEVLAGGGNPTSPLDWALHWAGLGLCIFPCERFLGAPLAGNWYKDASREPGKLIDWWSQEPTADIAAVPDKSGHFVILADAAAGGLTSLVLFQRHHGALKPEIQAFNAFGNLRLWIKGEAVTSHNRFGAGLHVLGKGHFVFMPGSYSPDQVWR